MWVGTRIHTTPSIYTADNTFVWAVEGKEGWKHVTNSKLFYKRKYKFSLPFFRLDNLLSACYLHKFWFIKSYHLVKLFSIMLKMDASYPFNLLNIQYVAFKWCRILSEIFDTVSRHSKKYDLPLLFYEYATSKMLTSFNVPIKTYHQIKSLPFMFTFHG